jgi:hypothetical protein
MNTAIPFIILLKLKIIFAEKKWGSEKELFNKFCNSLSVLTLDQQNCIMAITKNFLRIEFKDYPTHLINCLEQIQPSNKVYVLPLKKGGIMNLGHLKARIVLRIYLKINYSS